MKVIAKETFKIPGTGVIISEGQEFEVLEGECKECSELPEGEKCEACSSKEKKESLDLDEKQVDHDNKTVTMTKAEWKKVHPDYRGKQGDKDTALVNAGSKGTLAYTVVIKENSLREGSTPGKFLDLIVPELIELIDSEGDEAAAQTLAEAILEASNYPEIFAATIRKMF